MKENLNITDQQKHPTDKAIPFDAVVGLPPNTFLNIDCMALMKEMPDGFADLAIVDPQYGIGASQPSIKPSTVKQRNGKRLYIANNKHPQKDWDLAKMPLEYFEELKRVSKNQIIWGEYYEAAQKRLNEFRSQLKMELL